MSKCFICLDKANTKICPRCNCYAHSKCWGQYLENTTKVRTVLAPDEVLILIPWSASCPQCRGRIMNVKPVTRSDTHLGRKLLLAIDYSSFLSALDEAETQEERTMLYTKILNSLVAHKTDVRGNNVLTSLLKSRLSVLYLEENWMPANMYHYELFGTQIARVEQPAQSPSEGRELSIDESMLSAK